MSEATAEKLEISNVTLQEALEIIQLPYTEGAEKDVQFLSLMIEGLNELGTNEWNEVPDPIKLWYNSIAEKASQMEAAGIEDEDLQIPPIILVDAVEEPQLNEESDVDEVTQEEAEPIAEAVTEEDSQSKQPAKRGRKPKADKGEPAPKTESVSSKTRLHNLSKGITGAERIRQLVIGNCDITLDEALAITEKEGIQFKRSSAQVVYNGTKTAIDSILKYKKVKTKNGIVIIESTRNTD